MESGILFLQDQTGAFGGSFLQSAKMPGDEVALAKPVGADERIEAVRRVLGQGPGVLG